MARSVVQKNQLLVQSKFYVINSRCFECSMFSI